MDNEFRGPQTSSWEPPIIATFGSIPAAIGNTDPAVVSPGWKTVALSLISFALLMRETDSSPFFQ